MNTLFDKRKNDIILYCEQNKIDFQRLAKLPRLENSKALFFLKGPDSQSAKGLLNETPLKIVLEVQENKDKSLSFAQTEYTKDCQIRSA